MIFESHAHYEDEMFDKDREELLNSLGENGIGYVVNVASSVATTQKSLELAERYPWLYASAGVHPTDTGELSEEKFEWLSGACDHEKCVAVGEIGLDYYWVKEPEMRECQKYWFERQIVLAKEKSLPVIVHSREAAQDTMTVIKKMHGGEAGGVIHCFSGSLDFAKIYVDMGFYLGIGGVITYKNAKTLKEVVAWAPLERLLLETDCPYLSPVPKRGKRNSSLNLPYVVAAVAELKGVSEEEVIRITCENAKRMYRIDDSSRVKKQR